MRHVLLVIVKDNTDKIVIAIAGNILNNLISFVIFTI